jgi:hypothetical protein
MHRPVLDDQVRSLCLRQEVSHNRPATWDLHALQVAVHLNCTLAHKSRLQANRNVAQHGIVSPGHPFMVYCVTTMNENMDQRLFHSVPVTEMAIDRVTLLPLLRLVNVRSESTSDVRAHRLIL